MVNENSEDSRAVSRRSFLRNATQSALLGGAALGLGGALSPLIPGAKATTSNFQAYNYIVYSSSGTYYALNGMTGNIDYQSSSDAGLVIQYAIDHSNATNPPTWDTLGGRVFIKNMGVNSPYAIKSQVIFRSYVNVESDWAILQNYQGSLQFPFVSLSDRVLYRVKILGLVLDANSTSNGIGLAIWGPQRSEFDLIIKNCVTGLDLRSAPGNGVEQVLGYSASLSEYDIQVDNCLHNAALQVVGYSYAPATNNHFRYFRASNVGSNSAPATGLALVQWCDTNKFDTIWIGLTGNGSVGVNINNSTTQNQEVGIYNLQFDKLAIDAFNLTGCNAVYLNYSSGIQINQLFCSPDVDANGNWPSGNVLNFAYPQSYEIGDYIQLRASKEIMRRTYRTMDGNQVSASSNYTVAYDESTILANAGSGPITIFLPTANSNGREIVVIKSDSTSNSVTVQAAGGETIEGGSSKSLTSQYRKTRLRANGSGLWYDLASGLV